jgi:hypothetical protein
MLPTRERPTPRRLVVPALGAIGREVPPVDGRGAVTAPTWPLLPGYARRVADIRVRLEHGTGLESCCTRAAHEPAGSVGSRRPQPLTCRRSLHTHRSRHFAVLVRVVLSPVDDSAKDSNSRLARDAEASPSCASRSTSPQHLSEVRLTYVPSRTDENAAARSR